MADMNLSPEHQRLIDEVEDMGTFFHEATRALALKLARLEALEAATRLIVECYHRESEDLNDGEFALWRAEDLVNAIIAARALLAAREEA